jgi:hypothetical protein
MKRFLNNRTERATTALVLMVWLFALASGIANACLLEEARGNHTHVASIEEPPRAHAGADRSEQTTNHEGDADQSLAAKTLCLDACEERTNTLPKRNASLDPPLIAPLAVLAIAWIANTPSYRRFAFMDPVAVMQLTTNAEVAAVALEVRKRLQRVCNAMAAFNSTSPIKQ